jgi:hypothetical protein
MARYLAVAEVVPLPVEPPRLPDPDWPLPARPRRCIRELCMQGPPKFANVLSRNVKSYPQQVEYQDNEPPDYPTDRAGEHGKHVHGYVLGENEVGEEQKDQPYDPIDDEPTQKTARLAPAEARPL